MEIRDVQTALYFLVRAELLETLERCQDARDHEQELVARGSSQNLIRKATTDLVFWESRVDVLQLRCRTYRSVLGIVE